MDHVVINVFWRYDVNRSYGHTFFPLSRASDETIFNGPGHVRLNFTETNVRIVGHGDHWLHDT